MATNDDVLDVFIHDMLSMSDFVYRFANIRSIVKSKHGTTESTGWFGFFGEKKEIQFDQPALILTQEGAQEKDENRYVKYDITAPAISLFIEKNRNWFTASDDGTLSFDLDETSVEPLDFLEEALKDQAQDNVKIIDYVSTIFDPCDRTVNHNQFVL